MDRFLCSPSQSGNVPVHVLPVLRSFTLDFIALVRFAREAYGGMH